MSYLINRTPPARLKCLHNLMLFAVSKFKLSDTFYMGDLQYDNANKNVHHTCDLLIDDKSLGMKYCPYLENPLSDAGCNLTNGVLLDSTKKKEVSNTVNSLEALGFLNRENRELSLTKAGINFAKTPFSSTKMHTILEKAILGYGLSVGVLAQIYQLNEDEFSTDEISVGYPNTNEVITIDNQNITLSSGSQPDSNVRSKSTILAWLTACGFIVPKPFYDKISDTQLAHIQTLEYILSKNRNIKFYKTLSFPSHIFTKKYEVKNPLDYDNFTKNAGALRENGQEDSREITLKFEDILKNRRLAIVYLLNQAYLNKKKINFSKIIHFLKQAPKYFLINNETFENTMQIELNFAFVCGIPYKVEKNRLLKPLVSANPLVLCKNAPKEIIHYLTTFNDYE
ncbi:MAG: hypothetical protein ACKVTZ_02750 [Bacteroidia bacterium]